MLFIQRNFNTEIYNKHILLIFDKPAKINPFTCGVNGNKY